MNGSDSSAGPTLAVPAREVGDGTDCVDSQARAPDASSEFVRPWRWAFVVPVVFAAVWVPVTRALVPPFPLANVAGSFLLLALLVSVYTDLKWRRIFNWVTYTAVMWAAALQVTAAYTGPESKAILGTLPPDVAFGGFAFGFGLMFALYVTLGGGGGDLKLVTACGCYLGAERLLEGWAYSYSLAGVCVATYLIWTVGPMGLLAAIKDRFLRNYGPLIRLFGATPDLMPYRKMTIPMAPFYAFGMLTAVLTHPVVGTSP